MTRYAKRRDANHGTIRNELRAANCEVWDFGSAGHDLPDLLVGRREATLWVEVKTEDGEPTEGQQRMLQRLGGIVARTSEEVLAELDRREFGP